MANTFQDEMIKKVSEGGGRDGFRRIGTQRNVSLLHGTLPAVSFSWSIFQSDEMLVYALWSVLVEHLGELRLCMF